MRINNKNIFEDFQFNDVKVNQSDYAMMILKSQADKISEYLTDHVSNFKHLGFGIVYLFEEEKELLTKKNYPKGAFLIDSKLRVSTFNIKGFQLVDHENSKCPVKFYAVDDMSVISNTFESTVEIEYATYVSYYQAFKLKDVSALPKMCKKIQFVMSDEKDTNRNIDVLDISKSECHMLELRNYKVSKIITNNANEYITYMFESSTGFDKYTDPSVLPFSYRQYSNIENMFMNRQYNRSKYIQYFGYTAQKFYEECVYPRLDTVIGNDWINFTIKRKNVNEGLNFNDIQTADSAKEIADFARYNKTIKYLEEHIYSYDIKRWKIIPITELDTTVPSYVKKSAVMIQIALADRYENLIIIDIDGSVSTFNTTQTLKIYDRTCTELPIKFKNVQDLDLHCDKLTKPVVVENAQTLGYHENSIHDFQINCNCETLCFENVEPIKKIDVSKGHVGNLKICGDVDQIIISNNTKTISNYRYGSRRQKDFNILNVDTNETQILPVEQAKFENTTYDKNLDKFYNALELKNDLLSAIQIFRYEHGIKESLDFNSVTVDTDQDKKFLEHFVVEFLEACAYRNNYEYEITDDFSVNIKAFLTVDNETWPKESIPFKINKLEGSLLMNRTPIKSLDFMPNEITGSLSIIGCPNITEINELPEITGRQMLKGFIDIERNKNLKSIHLNNMSARKLMITHNKNLTDIILDYYETGYLKIQGNDNLRKIERFPVCLNGSVILYNNKNLEDITAINDAERIEKTVYIANTKIDTNTLSDYVRRKINTTTTKSVTR